MARISYVDPETVSDPQIRRWLEDAIRDGFGAELSSRLEARRNGASFPVGP